MKVEIGVIGGSGLYEIERLKNRNWIKIDTPWGLPSDDYLLGEIEGRSIAFLPRHGRGHQLLPSEINHRANIYGFKKLGVKWIIGFGLVGSLKEELAPGVFVVPSQFYDRTKQSARHTFFGSGIVAHITFAQPVCSELQQILFETSFQSGPAILGGTYVNMEGPAFSTLAEALENRRAGFDVVGMTNMGEAKCAREAEIAYATVAMVTDYDCWHSEHSQVTVEIVLDCLRKNAQRAQQVIYEAVTKIPLGKQVKAHRALKNAFLTSRNLWPIETIEKLREILVPYL